MTNKKNRDKLIELYDSQLKSERIQIKNILDGKVISTSLVGLRSKNEFFAIYEMVINNDFLKARQFYYNAAKCNEYSFKHFSEIKKIGGNFNFINYSILSDNKELIHETGKIETYKDYSFVNSVYIEGAQAMIFGDFERAKLFGNKMYSLSQQTRFAAYGGFGTVFLGYGEQNYELLNEGIEELLKTHSKRPITPFSKKHFSFDTLAVAKLALRNGIKIDVDNDMLPRPMLEIQELDNYSCYDFLNFPPETFTKRSFWQYLKDRWTFD